VLLIFGDGIARLLLDLFDSRGAPFLRILADRQLILAGAVFVILVFSQFRLGRAFVQAIYFILFIPIAILYAIYRGVSVLFRVPGMLRRFFTSRILHLLLWPATILSVYAVIFDWRRPWSPVYLTSILFAVWVLLILAFIFAFSPGVLHRLIVALALSWWKITKKDVDEKLASEQFSNDRDKREAKAKELTTWVSYGESLLKFFKASGRGAMIRTSALLLPLLLLAIVFLFAVAYLALAHMNSSSFEGFRENGFLSLLLFSLTNMFGSEPPGISPATDGARVLAAIQLICGVAIGLVLLLVVTTFSPEKFEEEVNQARSELQSAYQELQKHIERLRSDGEVSPVPGTGEGESHRNSR
jgi:hypothetical protein